MTLSKSALRVISRASVVLDFANLLMKTRSKVIALHLVNECCIDEIWKRCAILFLLTLKYKRIQDVIFCTRAFRVNNNLTTWIARLHTSNTSDLNTCHTQLFQILVQALIIKDEVFRPFWTPVYKELSEKLLLHTETASRDSPLISSNLLCKKLVARSQFSQTPPVKLESKTSPKICCQSCKSTAADKWVGENIKNLKLAIHPTPPQKRQMAQWFDTSNAVYNKTVQWINDNRRGNFYELRDKFVTHETRKTNGEYELLKQQLAAAETEEARREAKHALKALVRSVNPLVEEWELETPKDIRAGAVKLACSAYKSAMSNFRAGNIKCFNMGFHSNDGAKNRCCALAKSSVSLRDGKLRVTYLDEPVVSIKSRTLKRLKTRTIDHDCKLVARHGRFWLLIPIAYSPRPLVDVKSLCGVDPGCRTFMTIFGANGLHQEYKAPVNAIKRLNDKIDLLSTRRTNNKRRSLIKYENVKAQVIDKLHWDTVNALVNNYDGIFLGDIKSHDIVQKGRNKSLHRTMNDLKFFKFKQRLIYKAHVTGKLVVVVHEANTTKTCSACGTVNVIGAAKHFCCTICGLSVDRDLNAGKNILMKGLVLNGLFHPIRSFGVRKRNNHP